MVSSFPSPFARASLFWRYLLSWVYLVLLWAPHRLASITKSRPLGFLFYCVHHRICVTSLAALLIRGHGDQCLQLVYLYIHGDISVISGVAHKRITTAAVINLIFPLACMLVLCLFRCSPLAVVIPQWWSMLGAFYSCQFSSILAILLSAKLTMRLLLKFPATFWSPLMSCVERWQPRFCSLLPHPNHYHPVFCPITARKYQIDVVQQLLPHQREHSNVTRKDPYTDLIIFRLVLEICPTPAAACVFSEFFKYKL